MRIAIFSDIHGNLFALDHLLVDIKGQHIDQLVCLGDAIQGGPQPKETVQRLRGLNCPIVMGNADAWLLTGIETAHEPLSPERLKVLEAVRQWSLTKLNEDDHAFISSFQPTITISLDQNLDLLCFHGSPASFDDIILPDSSYEVFDKYLGTYAGKLLCGGHTHAQQIRRIGRYFFFNPGSVGVVFRHNQSSGSFKTDPWVEYAILTVQESQSSLEFRRVPYDVNELIHIYRESGRPYKEDAIEQYQT